VEAGGDAIAVAERFDFLSVVEGVPGIRAVVMDAGRGDVRIE
jgi:hypothetical protein